MKCIILAAGYATRLYPLTQNFPKPLLEVKGRPILDWIIEDVKDDIEAFYVISNHKFAPCFQEWALQHTEPVTVIDDGTVSNETRLGAVKDIQFALDHYDIQGDVFVMAGDNLLNFSLRPFIAFSREKGTSCVMCHEEHALAALQKTAVITVDSDSMITSYEEKPVEPKGELAVPPFYIYREQDVARIPEALQAGCGYDAPGSFAAWLSHQTKMHAYRMPGRRYDIGDINSYNAVRENYAGIVC